jgi:hypothetical protein
VDGKEAGQMQLTVVDQDDGSVYVASSAKLQVQHLLLTYNYALDTQEWYKEDKLIALKSFCNDNGKKHEVLVTGQPGQLQVKVNGIDRGMLADAWTTTYWKLADARYHNKQVPLLDIENGQDRTGQLQYIGSKQLPIGEQLIACYQFRVTGAGNPIDLWFDQHHRLVRQEFVESGHKTIVQLVGKK